MPYDEAKADMAVQFFTNYLQLIEGKWANRPWPLAPWQEHDIIRPLFGTVREDGLRQFRVAYIEIPRKNGKTPLAAGILLYGLLADREPGAQIYGGAYDKDQAKLVYRWAKGFIKRNRTLEQQTDIVDYLNTIHHAEDEESFYKVIAHDSEGSHGFNSHVVVIDEFHTFKSRDFYDALESSFGTREQPLLVIITTAGYDKNTVCRELHDYATNNFLPEDTTNDDWVNPYCYHTRPDSLVKDPSFFTYIRAADPEDDWTDPEVWKQANPAMPQSEDDEYGFRRADEVESRILRAQENVAYENSVKRLYLDIWTDSSSSWIAEHRWKACDGSLPEDQLRGMPCYGGLDLSSTTDITAFMLIFPIDGSLYTRLWAFIPEGTIRERAEQDQVPYQDWQRDGHIIATPGDWVDFETIKKHILRAKRDYKIHSINYDRWEATHMVQELMEEGLEMVPMGQGFRDMSAPTKKLIELTLSGTLQHGDNPVLNFASNSLALKTDPAENKKPDKKASTERIDPIVALIMGIDRWMRGDKNSESVYDKRVEEGKDPLLTIG